MLTEMSTQDYADMRGITSRAVTKAIVNSHVLPGVRSFKRWGRCYVLSVDLRELKKYLSDNQVVDSIVQK